MAIPSDISETLRLFGLDEKEAEVYRVLLVHEWVTALRLSQLVTVPRATLYRILERLVKLGLVEVQIDDKTTYYNAADPKQFESLIIEKEQKAQELRSAYSALVQTISAYKKTAQNETSVRLYRGTRGLMQSEWRLCSHRNATLRLFGSNKWIGALGDAFAEEIRSEMVKQGIVIRELENVVEPIKPDGTASFTKNIEYIRRHYLHRHLPKDILDITQDMYVVEDSIHLNGYRDGEYIALEIVSVEHAGLVRQIFDLLWPLGEPVDGFGGT